MNPATLLSGTPASTGYHSRPEPGPTVHPPASALRPSLVTTQNRHVVHSWKPVTCTDIVVPQVLRPYRTVAPSMPLLAVATSRLACWLCGVMDWVTATAPPTVIATGQDIRHSAERTRQ